eukprot:CAMPEP_0113481142 /NCGR_PEP_ID=MMETSP0014_2-20120614/22254_1 /TAXON_ID=2857 /ORGANISM="Nitzschia sp." /LENGTH=43 /DNA_ID=CAMNT_0000374625 /DNA_START=125 /DNA_END=256 /DNA_ORIENTATION=+ /assembly_acc=CAM_ASM_000159
MDDVQKRISYYIPQTTILGHVLTDPVAIGTACRTVLVHHHQSG